MIMVTIGEQCIVVNDCDTHRAGSKEIDGQARGMRSKETSDGIIRLPLLVDCQASCAAKAPRGREAPSRLNRQFGEDSIDERNSNSLEDDAPFVIARRLLRRRHVKKEQLRKEREAREELNVRDIRNYRKRKAAQYDNEPSCKRVSTAGTLPHPSPMLSKSDSFVGLCQTTDKDQGNVDGEAVLGAPSVANTMIFHSTSLITFSPLRSRSYRS